MMMMMIIIIIIIIITASCEFSITDFGLSWSVEILVTGSGSKQLPSYTFAYRTLRKKLATRV